MSFSFDKKHDKSSPVAGSQAAEPSASSAKGSVAHILRLQQTAGNQAVAGLLDPELSTRGSVPGSEGRPLSSEVRSLFEDRFGQDFSKVRVHTGGAAAEAARSLNAVAYTSGNDIVFDAGKFNPQSKPGQHLLAHELAHVVQQSRGGAAPESFDSSSGLEHGAANAATQFGGGGPVSVCGASLPGVARQENPDVPRWKKLLNPLYQKALEVLPRPAAEELENLNERARTLMQQGVITDAQVNAVVDAAQPLVQQAQQALDSMNPPEPPPPTAPPVWLGRPPISVQVQQFREQKQQLAELKKTDPSATELDLPVPQRLGALSAEDLLGFDPLRPLRDSPPTDFEKRLEAKQPFRHTMHMGSRSGQTEETVNIGTVNPEDVMPIRDLPTGEILHYNYRPGGGVTVYTLDREGQPLTTTGLEAPLETPIVDPIDVALVLFDVGPLAAKGLAIGVRELGNLVSRSLLKETEEAVLAGAVRRTPAQVAQDLATRYSGRLVDSNNALANIIERARHPSLRVDGRAAAAELRGIIDILEEGVGGRAAARVEVIPSSSAGRTPDLVIHFADGSTTRYEMRTLTSAPRGHVTPKADLGSGALARSLAEDTARRPVSRSQIAQAILDKARVTATRPSQLTAPLAGVAPGGTISVNVTAATTNTTIIDGAVQSAASRLGPHVERIDVSYLLPRSASTDPLTRGVLTYVRQPNGTYLRMPRTL
jgi:hypothetical protein